MTDGGRERRESGRAKLELPIEYDRLNELLSDYTHNISRGGTFIRTDHPLEVGTELSFAIRAPALAEPILLKGVVRWVVQASKATDHRPAGMGIAFVFDTLGEKDSLEARLDRLMVQSLGPVAYEKLMGKPAPELEGSE